MADDNVSDAFRSLPMDTLIGAPFSSACKSNIMLAEAMYDYVTKVAFEVGQDGKPTDKTRLLEFDLEQPYTDPKTNAVSTMKIAVKAPFLGLVPIPSLLIDNVSVNFTMTVKASTQDTTKVDASADFGMSQKSFNFQASLKTSNERIRNTDQEATYVVHAEANQQQQTEGLSKLMDIMASCIAPLGTGGGGGGG